MPNPHVRSYPSAVDVHDNGEGLRLRANGKLGQRGRLWLLSAVFAVRHAVPFRQRSAAYRFTSKVDRD